MRSLILIIFIAISASSSGQMNRLFYGDDWNQSKNLIDSISAVTGYKVDSVSVSKSGRSTMYLLVNEKEAGLITVDVLKYSSAGKETIGLVQITGDFGPLYKLYNNYAVAHVADYVFQTDGDCATGAQIAKLADGRIVPISFCNSKTKRGWVLASHMPY